VGFITLPPTRLARDVRRFALEKGATTPATCKDVLPLTADLTPAELAEALGALRFRGPNRCLVSLDKDVRDYILRAIRAR
jgi:hypothetical protein